MILKASSHEPGFRDFVFALNPLENFRCVHVRGRADSVLGISVRGLKILPYEHFSPVTGMKAGWILAARMALSCIAYCVFHIISIPFNCIDTALRVVKAMVGAKLEFLCFTVFALFLEFRARTRPEDL